MSHNSGVHNMCAAQCGALFGVGSSIALAGWLKDTWSLRKLLSASAAIIVASAAVGVLSGDLVSHATMMSVVKPFANCSSVGMVAFGAAATSFKLLVDESIYGNKKVLAASFAIGLAVTYAAVKFL
jgi:hypothetical protein